MLLTNSSFYAIIYHVEIVCARLGEHKQLLSPERSGSMSSMIGGLAYTLQESFGFDTPV